MSHFRFSVHNRGQDYACFLPRPFHSQSIVGIRHEMRKFLLLTLQKKLLLYLSSTRTCSLVSAFYSILCMFPDFAQKKSSELYRLVSKLEHSFVVTVLILFLFCLSLISCRKEEPLLHGKQDVSFLLDSLNCPFSYKPICFGGGRLISFVSREGPLLSDTSSDGRHKCCAEQEEGLPCFTLHTMDPPARDPASIGDRGVTVYGKQ